MADLYTGHIASVEWKVDSSDLILIASVSSEEDSGKVMTDAERASRKAVDRAMRSPERDARLPGIGDKVAFWTKQLTPVAEESRRASIGFPLMALINYPGEQTEQLLEQLATSSGHDFSARLALRYLRFYQEPPDRHDPRLIGSWSYVGRTERVQFDLMDDFQLLAHRRPIPYPHPSKHQREWWSKGRWNLHHGRLWMMSTELRFVRSKKFTAGRAPLPRFDEIPIERIKQDEIDFKGGVILRRVGLPIELPSSPEPDKPFNRQETDEPRSGLNTPSLTHRMSASMSFSTALR
jgi:hypothetical protein